MTTREKQEIAKREARTIANNTPDAAKNTAIYIAAFTAAYKAAYAQLES